MGAFFQGNEPLSQPSIMRYLSEKRGRGRVAVCWKMCRTRAPISSRGRILECCIALVFACGGGFVPSSGPVLAAFVLTSALGFAMLGGCASLRPKPPVQYVYVTAKETFLRDRLAAVTNRTGTVENGEKLEVLEHARRYFRVKTPKGEVGWIDEKAVATQQVFDAFQALGKEHKGDPAVASALVRDEVNLHVKPGRQTEVFYRLPEGDKLQLLERATLPSRDRLGGPRPRP